ncbi:MAG: DNA-formamidopyrimidine glycosylase family protein [bacterium]
MPELPFIQVLVDNLAPRITGRTIRHVHLASPSVLKTVEPPLSETQGRAIERVRRTGKLILLDLDGGLSVAFHLMRNGRLQVAPARVSGQRSPRPSKDVALIMMLDDDQELRFVEIGPKKRAALYVLPADGMFEREPLQGLGLDPLSDEFTPDRLKDMLAQDAGQLKHFLTLQRYITGIGNAFSDEILWAARLSPFVRASKLAPEEIATLYQGIRATLIRGLQEHRQAFTGNLPTKEPLQLLRVHRHGGEPCPRCGTKIAQVAYAEKETYYCPSCQTGGKVYADRRLSRLLK